ncbi:MAG: hypothetical protein LBV65_03845 [Desulfovibrio sp.]|nr:hypothetical protein [Desulfovibrio sp.]
MWTGLGCPLIRLLLGLAVGLLIANILEALRWTRRLSAVAAPLVRSAHLREEVGAAFALAFVSPAAANGLLAQSHDSGQLSDQELTLANLLNSLPACLVHTPTLFFLIWPVIGTPAVPYVGLTLLAAAVRTGFTVALGRCLLPDPVLPQPEKQRARSDLELLEHKSQSQQSSEGTDAVGQRAALYAAWRRFMRRLPKLVCFTAPVYVLMYVLHRCGAFQAAETWLAAYVAWPAFLQPQTVGIIALHLMAEFGAALGAAGAVLQTGSLTAADVVLALLVGNILSTPMRALRHQLPAYSGLFHPRLALRLILANQTLRAVSMTFVTMAYYYCA